MKFFILERVQTVAGRILFACLNRRQQKMKLYRIWEITRDVWHCWRLKNTVRGAVVSGAIENRGTE